jgi:hypothetical protein
MELASICKYLHSPKVLLDSIILCDIYRQAIHMLNQNLVLFEVLGSENVYCSAKNT